MQAGMDDVEMVEREIPHRDAHRLGRGGSLRVLELETDTATGVGEQQIEFRAAVGSPRVRGAVAAHAEDLLEAEPLPRRA